MISLLLVSLLNTASAEDRETPKLVLAHYMPWFEAKPISPQ